MHCITLFHELHRYPRYLPAPSPYDPCFIGRAYYGNMNFFGGPSTTSVKASAKLKQLEEENEDAMFVIVSDVWLDSVEVMEKLNLMFSGLVSLQVENLHQVRHQSHLV